MQGEDKALRGLVLCLLGAGEIIVFRVWREWRRVKRRLGAGGRDRRGEIGDLDSRAMAARRRAGPGGLPHKGGWMERNRVRFGGGI